VQNKEQEQENLITEETETETEEPKEKPHWNFRSKEELNGEIDPRINVKGQPRNQRPMGMTRRANHQSELVSLLRKLKPHMSAAVIRTSSIVSNPNSKDSDAVAAAKLLLSTYQSLMQDLYKEDKEEQVPVIVQELPKFRLTVQEQQ